MRRRLAIVVALAIAALTVGEAHAERELWPGVTFRQVVQPTPNGPVVMDVLTGPRPGGLTTLQPLLSNGTLTGRQTLTALERRYSGAAVYAGVNGDFFNFRTGLPSGGLVADSAVVATPSSDRSTAGVTADGTLDVRRVTMTGSWTGGGVAHPLVLNRTPDANGAALFTSAWGASTPAVPGSVAVVLFPLAPLTPGLAVSSTAQSLVAGASSVAIPPDGAVLVGRGAEAAEVQQEAAAGAAVTIRLDLDPAWPGLVAAIGGGPEIVRDGAPVFRAGEAFVSAQIAPRDPRTAIGQLRDGRIVLVTVDGRQSGWSVGVTNFELAKALVRLGARTAMALDSGGSTTMAFDGTLLNRPSDGRERAISTAVAFAYTGAFLPDPEDVVSPNGDGFDDKQALAYRLVRQSTVTVTLTAPDGSAAYTQTGDFGPGSYPVPFPGASGGVPLEGTWQLAVTAVDDGGQQSSMSRSFTVDDTLGFLETSAPRLFLPPGGRELTISWKQTRPARVAVTVETKDGTVVRSFARRALDAGDQSVVWNGLGPDGTRVKGGVYRAHVVATSAIGTSELIGAFTVRQIAG